MVKYNCKTCGAEIFFDAEAGKMKCKYCDSTFDVTDFASAANNNASNVQYSKADADSVATDDSEAEQGALSAVKPLLER